MLVLVVLAVLAAAVLLLVRGDGDGDVPARIVNAAAGWLPEPRRDWGRAMAAELTQIDGRGRRWRFTASALRVVLFPPPRHRRHVLAAGLGGLAVAAGSTVAAATEVPDLSVFVAVLGLLLCGYATVVTSRSVAPLWTVPGVIVGAVALAGVAAAIIAVTRIAVAHPAAAADGNHVFSVVFAFVLAGYLAFALTPCSLDQHARTGLWWALAAALAGGAVWIVIALAEPVQPDGITGGYPWLVGGAVTLAASIGAAAATGSGPAGARAGLLAAILSAPMHFATDLTAILQVGHYTLTNPYDIAAYPHSGYPDVASYLLSDEIAGDIIGGLVLYPVVLLALAMLGASAGTRLRISRA